MELKKICLPLLIVGLTGCFGSNLPTLDASNPDAIKSSVALIKQKLPEAQQKELEKAIAYFTIGGVDGMKNMFGAALSGADPEEMMVTNLKEVNGLTGEEILAKYKEELAKNRKK